MKIIDFSDPFKALKTLVFQQRILRVNHSTKIPKKQPQKILLLKNLGVEEEIPKNGNL